MAMSVPNSRVRRETPEIVNSTARASATARTMSESQVPRFVMSDDALESDPETVAARSDCELTVASGSALERALCYVPYMGLLPAGHVPCRRGTTLKAPTMCESSGTYAEVMCAAPGLTAGPQAAP